MGLARFAKRFNGKPSRVFVALVGYLDVGVPACDLISVTLEAVVKPTRFAALAPNVWSVHLLLRELARAGMGVVGSRF